MSSDSLLLIPIVVVVVVVLVGALLVGVVLGAGLTLRYYSRKKGKLLL